VLTKILHQHNTKTVKIPYHAWQARIWLIKNTCLEEATNRFQTFFYVNSITIMQNWKYFGINHKAKTFWKQWYATYEQKPYLKFDNAMRKIVAKISRYYLLLKEIEMRLKIVIMLKFFFEIILWTCNGNFVIIRGFELLDTFGL